MDREQEITDLRRKLAELESHAGDEVVGAAPETPPPAPPVKSSGPKKGIPIPIWVFGGVGLFFLLLLFSQSLGGGGAPKTVNAGSQPTTAELNHDIDRQIAENADLAPPVQMSKWLYQDIKDPMTDRLTRTACVSSSNMVTLNPPYSDVSAQMCVRQSPRHGLDVYILLNGDGQIICRSYDGCSARTRFDANAPQGFGATDAADGSSNIVFISSAQKFVTGLKAADTTRVELMFYEAGNQTLEFNTAGLEWPRPAPAG
jgi:hypothetical protein